MEGDTSANVIRAALKHRFLSQKKDIRRRRIEGVNYDKEEKEAEGRRGLGLKMNWGRVVSSVIAVRADKRKKINETSKE